jgi:hypothetical protein
MVEHEGKMSGFKELLIPADSAFTKVFQPKMLEGTEKALEEPGKVLVSQSIASRFCLQNPSLRLGFCGRRAIVPCVILATVSLQSYKAATQNPVQALSTE